MADGRDKSGRFTEGHKYATGRPPGARNKPYDNGVHPFLEEDGRLAPARRFRSLITRMVEDLGGEGALSTGQQQLVRRCAMISVQCELMEQAAVRGEGFDLAIYGELTDRLGRALQRLGLKREPRDVTPTLKDYLEAVRSPSAVSEGSDVQ